MLLSHSQPQFPIKKRGVLGLVTIAVTKEVAALVRCSAQSTHVLIAREIAPAFVFQEIVVNNDSQGRRTAPSPSSACTRGASWLPGRSVAGSRTFDGSGSQHGTLDSGKTPKTAVGRERGL